jgi:hypothetical protein
MPLTDRAIRNAKPGDKPIRLFDGGGMYSRNRAGWRALVALLKYRFGGRKKNVSRLVFTPIVSRSAAGT